MKTFITVIAVLTACFALSGQAQDESLFRVGAHGAYSAGGDIEKSKAGYGIQAEVAVIKYIGIELSVSRFSDEYSEEGVSLDQDLTTIGLSVVGRAPLVQKLQGYLLAGVDYNITDMDASINPAAFDGIAMKASVDVDNSVGVHFAAGLNLPFHKNWELFAEYRYTILDLEGDVSVSAMGITESEKIDGDYNFGLVKLGVNYLF